MSNGLTKEDRALLDELFDRALELPQAQYAAFAEEKCGSNAALRGALLQLLTGLAGEDVVTRVQTGVPSRSGAQIGPYLLLERVGLGGMGEVYAAEQRDPVERRVALKLIRPGMDSAEIVVRFEAERQALARMTHPNVAQVLDLGTTDDGRPYFVMEFVAGEPITEYCDRRQLITGERLGLFLGICDGVQHAHLKGVVHRDLKPGNLLVTEQDGHPTPKVIDFGVARATTGRLAEHSLHTMVGQVVGTLDYMSPEQADPGGVDVDTRSDVYSLGVVLYQLLSGLLPFEHDSEAGLSFSEIQRVIREKDPLTPSTRLKRETETATTIAPLHGADVRSLARQLTGDLDWICLKALEKDPARRYQSVAELAEDVRRHLAHEPVLAGRPDVFYRARKFVRRNRLVVTAGLLVTAALVAGVVGIVSGRAEAEERAAEALAETAKFQRMSDHMLLQDLVTEAGGLWPPHPDRIPDLEDWVERAGILLANRAVHRERLEELRAGALPWTAAEREHDQKTHPRAKELATKRARLANRIAAVEGGLPPDAEDRALDRIAVLESEVEALTEAVETRRTWRFDDPTDRWWHGVLEGILAIMDTIEVEVLPTDAVTPTHGWSVPRRLVEARELEAGFSEGGALRQAWEADLPAIRAAYAILGTELELGPQMGLKPLGPDPRSGLWEFAHLLSGEVSVRDAGTGELHLTPESGVVLVLIPGGSFLMGAQSEDPASPNYDPDAHEWRESPVHEVDVEPFFLSKYELTRMQWWRSTNEDPSSASGWGGRKSSVDDRPVDRVTWTDSKEVAQRLGLVLPHEEQWEYAARAGTMTPWSTGKVDRYLEGSANLWDKSAADRMPAWHGSGDPTLWSVDDGYVDVAPVGDLEPNAFGLHDTMGNVFEWCGNSLYHYGGGPNQPPPHVHSVRGGSFQMSPLYARSSCRFDGDENFITEGLGLRPARSIDALE